MQAWTGTCVHGIGTCFLKDEVQIICATIAFGMGIDKSNVRFVIHYDLPKNIESYHKKQDARGVTECRVTLILLYSAGDVTKMRGRTIGDNPNKRGFLCGSCKKWRITPNRACKARMAALFREHFAKARMAAVRVMYA